MLLPQVAPNLNRYNIKAAKLQQQADAGKERLRQAKKQLTTGIKRPANLHTCSAYVLCIRAFSSVYRTALSISDRSC